MMLTKDTMEQPDKSKPAVVKDKGTRTLASEYFSNQSFNNIRNQLLNATVRLRTKNAPYCYGSGVILSAQPSTKPAKPGKAYVLTAKHLLYTLRNQAAADVASPKQMQMANFCNSIEIGYAPTGLLQLPAQTANVSGVYFGNKGVCNDSSWEYDVVILESTDAAFITHVQNNRFLNQQSPVDYEPLFTATNAGDYPILKKDLFEFFQLGYGKGRVEGIGNPDDYQDYEGRIQIRRAEPEAAKPIDNAFEIQGDDPTKWEPSKQICLFKAGKNSSTAGGDSGGPLFCRPIKLDKNKGYLNSLDKFFLVGVTAGADFFLDENYKKKNAKLPATDVVHNNAVTFWRYVYNPDVAPKDWLPPAEK